MIDSTKAEGVLDNLLGKAKAKGADAGDAVYIESTSIAVAQRLGNAEKFERSEGADIGLRVFAGKSQAIVSSSDTSPEALDELAERGVAMAKSVPEDPFCGLAEPEQLATEFPEIDSFDKNEPAIENLVDWANRAEETARSTTGVTNSEGAEAGWGRATLHVAATNGFAQSYSGSNYSLSVSVLAGEGTAMERDYDYTSSVYAEDLMSPEDIGRSAGERAVRRLNPKKVETTQAPVVYDNRVARSLISHFAAAINGSSVARNTSFLKDKMDEMVFHERITIVDDPHRRRGLRSKPFDAEGVANQHRKVIENGRLTTWIMDLRSSRQLGLTSTGHATRSTGSPPEPSATNLYIEAGEMSPAELIKDVSSGFYVTELIGFGVNGLTGDYSRGASGFWIENGEVAYPVSEMTIAGNLKNMFMSLAPANDLVFRYGVDSPTIRVEGMTIAGK